MRNVVENQMYASSHDTGEIYHYVDVRQDGRADDVRDGARAEGHDDQD